MTSADIVIIGGGVAGSASAYWLTRPGTKAGRVVIVERDTSYAYCSTARSAGGVRLQFSTPENIELSKAMVGLLRDLKSEFVADADIPFKEQGYLILGSEAGRGILESNAAIQRAHGAVTEIVDASAIASRFPWINTDGLAAGSYGPRNEGWIDPVLVMTLLRNAAIKAGAQVVKGEVVGIARQGDRVTGVTLTSGETISCGAIVNAAGAFSGKVAGMAGIAVPVEPRKRYVYVIDSRRATEAMRLGPLTVDPSGGWFRPEGRTFICGVSPDDASEPPAEDLDHVDYTPFEEIVWPTLAARVPAFEEAKLMSAWAGYYDYNTLDQNAIIGALPPFRNFYVVTGFSGHGLQQGYAAGRGIAELVLTGGFKTIDLKRFGYDRIAKGEPLLELNVI